MRTRTRIIGALAIILMVTAFLAGYWPQRQRRVDAEAERSSLQSRMTILEDRVRAAQLHVELLNLIDAIEAMNYGQAQTRATALFDHVRAELARTRDEQLRSPFEELLTRRDTVTAALANADAAALAPLTESEGKLRQVLGAAAAGG